MTVGELQHAIAPGSADAWSRWLGRLGPLIGLALVVALFSALRPQTFPTIDNAELILRHTAVVGIAALGMTLIIISGGIDLSVGSAIALCTVAIALLLPHALRGPDGNTLYAPDGKPILGSGLPPALAALGGIMVTSVCGLAIGTMVIGHVGRVAAIAAVVVFLVLYRRLGPAWGLTPLAALAAGTAVVLANEKFIRRIHLSPFIVTLGMWGALRGAAKGLASNETVYPAETWLRHLLIPIDPQRLWLLTPGAWLMILLAIAVAAMLRYSRFGRHIFAIGSNEQAARLCGVPVERTKLAVYTVAGLLTGIAGLLLFSRLTVGDSTTAMGMELDVIAAVVIGGGSLAGGQGSVLGTLMGALIMSSVANGCTKMGWPNWVQEIVTGAIIVVAVALDNLRRRSQQS
jgi:ribose transport system permease protein